MPIRSIKNKINDIASGEILGETVEEKRKKKAEADAKARAKAEMKAAQKNKRKEKKERSVKEKRSKEKISEERKVSKESFFKRKDPEPEIIEDEEKNVETEKENKTVMINDSVEGYQDVLSILNIKENLNLEVDFKSSDLDYIEFTPTAPVGFDFDEVTDFISRVKYTVNRYEAALEQRNKDLILVASEVKKVEKRMIEQNHARELEKIIGDMTVEERLIEENTDLKIELNNLKGRLIDDKANPSLISKLEEEIKTLRAENEMLVMNSMGSNEKSNSLPAFDEPEKIEKPKIPAFKPSNVQMPDYEEDDDILDEMLSDGKDNVDKMMENL